MKFLKQLWFWLKPFVAICLDTTGPVLTQIAREVVIDLMATDADGEERREIARYEIKKKLAARGIEMADRLVNAAIEAAVNQLKGA